MSSPTLPGARDFARSVSRGEGVAPLHAARSANADQPRGPDRDQNGHTLRPEHRPQIVEELRRPGSFDHALIVERGAPHGLGHRDRNDEPDDRASRTLIEWLLDAYRPTRRTSMRIRPRPDSPASRPGTASSSGRRQSRSPRGQASERRRRPPPLSIRETHRRQLVRSATRPARTPRRERMPHPSLESATSRR